MGKCFSVNALPIAEMDVGAEAPVHRAGGDSEQPWCFVGDGALSRTVVASGAHQEDAHGHGTERANRDGVLIEAGAGTAAKGEREHVHPMY